jgi:thiamine-phosphate pyrophosphorylase
MVSRPKQADPRPAPRLYLITPRLADTSDFAAPLAAALEAADVAAVLLRLAEADEGTLIKRAKALAESVQQRGVALLIDGRPGLVARARADGAHVTGIAAFSEAIDALKPDWIVGCGGLATRHDAMLAAEQGADYVMFGEPDEHGARPAFAAIEERVAWWAEVFEAPCVGYAASRAEIAPLAKAGADFIALGDWLWAEPALPATLTAIAQDLKLPETTT